MVTASSRHEAKICAERGEAAFRRYLTGPPASQHAEFTAAVADLTEALRCLPADDPMRPDVSFLLGTVRLAAHDKRCGKQCPAPGEFTQIVELIAAGGARDRAPASQLSLYAIVLDQLYDHTHDPADIELAIDWLRRAARDRRLTAADRRRKMISIAVQYANRGVTAEASAGRSGPGTESWAAFDAAISQFDEVLTEAGRRAGWRDGDRATDRLDAWLGQLETYYQRGGGTTRSEDLAIMAGLARKLVTGMVPAYHVRPYALGRAGIMLIQRLSQLFGDPWDSALNAAVLSKALDPISAAVSHVPGFGPDLELAIGALSEAVTLTDPADDRQPLYTAGLSAAHGMRYLAFFEDDDLRAVGRLCRAVLGHPRAAPYHRRQCCEWLLAVLARRATGTGAVAAAGPGTSWPKPSPSADGDLDTMLGLLAGFAAEDGAKLASALSVFLTDSVLARTEGNLSDAELGAEYARAREAAASLTSVPAMHAVLQRRAAEIGAQLVARAAAGMADEVAAAFSGARPAPTEELPPVLDVFSLRALAALGVGSQGWLAGTAGMTANAATALLPRQSRVSARRAAVLSVLALARYATWLRERTGDGLGGSLDHVNAAIRELPHGHPLGGRLRLLLARMLLDRAQAGGDLADADSALTLLEGLRAEAAGQPVPGDLGELLARAGPPQLRELLTAPPAGHSPLAGDAGYRLDIAAAVGAGLLLRGILTGGTPGLPGIRSPDGDSGARADLGEAIAVLRQVAESLPVTDLRRPDVLSDLGLALLAAGQEPAGAPAAAQALREAAATAIASSGHPRLAAILLRAAAALAAAEGTARRAAAGDDDSGPTTGYDPRVVEEGIGLLTRALSTAGLTASGERSRCLYGLGSVLLIRFSRTGRPADLSLAIARLEEARAGVEAVPGDPFLVSLLRALAWAHRQDAYRLAREHVKQGGRGPLGAGAPRLPLHRSRSAGRSLLYAHAQSVLLQGGSRHALAASRAIGRDALTLAQWCIADGRVDSAVEALELGRGLVLHAATVAADIPALLGEAGQPGLASQWRAEASPARGEGRDIDAIPGDLRGRVLAALRSGTADRRLLAAPSVASIAGALREAGLAALAYLIPASGAVRGRAVVVGADGTAREFPLPDLTAGPGTPVALFASADAQRFKRELDSICDWAWTAAVGPLLDHLAAAPARPLRLAIVPIGLLGLVPWHAARHGEPGNLRYACADVIFTSCASARQLIEAIGRARRAPGTGPAVFVANPSGDLPGSQLEAEAIRAAFYPGAVYLGRSARTPVNGTGSPDEVLACLPGGGPDAIRPAVLHLGCHATAGASPEESRLALAAGAVLPVSRILAQARHRDRDVPGGLVVLAACTSDLAFADYDEALTLASAFLAAGATAAIGARWAVHDEFTALLMFMFHHHLVRSPGDGPAGALRAAQLWMLDRRRQLPPQMPRELAERARSAASHPYAWAAFTCHGQ